MIALVILLGIFSFLAPRNEKGHGSGLECLRYVVEQTLAWLRPQSIPAYKGRH